MKPSQILKAERTCEQCRWKEKRQHACARKGAIGNGHLNMSDLHRHPSILTPRALPAMSANDPLRTFAVACIELKCPRQSSSHWVLSTPSWHSASALARR